MEIRTAAVKDAEKMAEYDRHICLSELKRSIAMGRVYVAEEDGCMAGFLRYNLFWDNTPFMNMLYLKTAYRRRGFGKALVKYWEKEMGALGYQVVMTSTSSEESARFFYQKLGYEIAGGFFPQNEPYELILKKEI